MPVIDIDRCLLALREAELILLENGESVLAAQLSIVTGRLLLRYPETMFTEQ
jgi:hypothetical protein